MSWEGNELDSEPKSPPLLHGKQLSGGSHVVRSPFSFRKSQAPGGRSDLGPTEGEVDFPPSAWEVEASRAF